MTAPTTSEAFLELVRKSGLIEQDRLDRHLERREVLAPLPSEPMELATDLIRDGFLTYFQAKELLKGKHRGFTLGKYKVLERIGSGGNGSVFLCEHVSEAVLLFFKHEVLSIHSMPLQPAQSNDRRFQPDVCVAESALLSGIRQPCSCFDIVHKELINTERKLG